MCSQPPNKIKDRHSSLKIDACDKITHHPFILRFIPLCLTSANRGRTPKLRVVAYNVACGQWATPERIAKELKDLKPDIVLLSEVPKANRGKKVKDWSRRLADRSTWIKREVGTVSSANHKAPQWEGVTGDYGGKFKSVLSRTPLSKGKDYLPEGSGWGRASAFVWRLKSMGGNSRSTAFTCRDSPTTSVNQPKPLLGRGRNKEVWPSE